MEWLRHGWLRRGLGREKLLVSVGRGTVAALHPLLLPVFFQHVDQLLVESGPRQGIVFVFFFFFMV